MIGDRVSQRSERTRHLKISHPKGFQESQTSCDPGPRAPSTLILSLYEIKIYPLVPQLAVAVSPFCWLAQVRTRAISSSG